MNIGHTDDYQFNDAKEKNGIDPSVKYYKTKKITMNILVKIDEIVFEGFDRHMVDRNVFSSALKDNLTSYISDQTVLNILLSSQNNNDNRNKNTIKNEIQFGYTDNPSENVNDNKKNTNTMVNVPGTGTIDITLKKIDTQSITEAVSHSILKVIVQTVRDLSKNNNIELHNL